MGRKRRAPNDPREWLCRAQSNLSRAISPLADAYLEDFCFDAQQAAEKAMKAVFMAHGLTFPYIHDLGRLLTLLVQGGGPGTELRPRRRPIDPVRGRRPLSRSFQPRDETGSSSGRADRITGLELGDATS